jgi:hypothetical protein
MIAKVRSILSAPRVPATAASPSRALNPFSILFTESQSEKSV